MKDIYTGGVRSRLEQLFTEISTAGAIDYYDRLRELRRYCDSTPALANCLAQLPDSHYDFKVDSQDLSDRWPEGEAGIAYRWDAIRQVVDRGCDGVKLLWQQLMIQQLAAALRRITELFVIPVCHYLLHNLEESNVKLYLLLRYKRWAEWFEAERLREIYVDEGEAGLDRDLRRFLFESGVDYPLSQPRSPRGQADIVADLDTDEPLVLEVKVWDSENDYRENRVRDGLRQVMDYADKYGKDKGYVPVFNLDTEPLVFVPEADGIEWPARIERGGKTYFFVAINVAEQQEPISERDKGKPVKTNEVRLDELFRGFENV